MGWAHSLQLGDMLPVPRVRASLPIQGLGTNERRTLIAKHVSTSSWLLSSLFPKACRNIHLRFKPYMSRCQQRPYEYKRAKACSTGCRFLALLCHSTTFCFNVENILQVMIVGCCLTAMLRFRGQGVVSLRLLISKTCLQFWTPGSFPQVSAIKFNNRSNSANCGGPLELKDDAT